MRIKAELCHHSIKMRTTLDIDSDVLNLARTLAEAHQTSIGKALSNLARRGALAQTPVRMKDGFGIFEVPAGSPSFGPDDIREAMDEDDRSMGAYFVERERS